MLKAKPRVVRVEDLRVVNCACCGVLMLGESDRWMLLDDNLCAQGLPPTRLHARIGGRPYCRRCMEPRGLASPYYRLTTRQLLKLSGRDWMDSDLVEREGLAYLTPVRL